MEIINEPGKTFLKQKPEDIGRDRLSSFVFSKEIVHPVHPKGDQSWVFIGTTDAEAETPVLSLPHAKS